MKLESIVDINHGTILSRVKDPLKVRDNKLPMLALQNLSYELGANTELHEQMEYVGPDNIKKCVFGKVGNIALGLTVSKAMVLTDLYDNYLIPSNFALLEFDCNILHPYYLMWYVNESNRFRRQVGVLTQGSSVKSLSIRQLRDIKITLPVYEEQMKIGELYRLILRKEKLNQTQKKCYLSLIKGSMSIKEEK